MKPMLSFPINVESFVAEPRRRTRWLATTNQFPHSIRAGHGDDNMEEENKKR